MFYKVPVPDVFFFKNLRLNREKSRGRGAKDYLFGWSEGT